MRLGRSLRRRRDRARQGPGRIFRLTLVGLAVAAVGFGGGYLLATELLFPAPEPPDELIEVPDLRGTARADALDEVRRAGLVAGPVDSLRHPTRPAGTVVGQGPLPGQRVMPGDTVRLTLSMGPERRAVPDISRVPAERALTVLSATGFDVVVDSVDSPRPRGTVLSIEPEAGTALTLPGEVRLEVSLGPPTVPMPVLLGMRQERAISALDSLGLVVGEMGTQFQFGLARGIVVEQDPAAGTMVERGSAVRIVVGRR